MLVGSRVLQGAMAAVMIPQVLSIIQASFQPGERAGAFAAYGAAAGLANVSGPPVAATLLVRESNSGASSPAFWSP